MMEFLATIIGGVLFAIVMYGVFMDSVVDIVIGFILTIGGFIYKAYINNSIEVRMEAFFDDGITDLESFGNVAIAIGIIFIAIGVIRYFAEEMSENNKERMKQISNIQKTIQKENKEDNNTISKLEELKKMKESELITQEEFEDKRQEILGKM